jgi:hypothetical protein
MMPYISSQFMPRNINDRPKVIPEGCVNLAFIGQFVELPGDVVFTVELLLLGDISAIEVDADLLVQRAGAHQGLRRRAPLPICRGRIYRDAVGAVPEYRREKFGAEWSSNPVGCAIFPPFRIKPRTSSVDAFGPHLLPSAALPHLA